MPGKIKPKWVEALDKAEIALSAASEAQMPEEMDSKVRLAYGWMDIAKLLKKD